MILGIGIDLIEFQDFLRIYKFLKNRKIFKYIFFKEELIFKNNYKKLAGIFALKEAVYKAMSPYLNRETLLKDIKIIKQENGKIIAEISKKYFLSPYQKNFFTKNQIKIKFFLSLSYSPNFVIAISIAEFKR